MQTLSEEDARKEIAAALAGGGEMAMAASAGGHLRVNLVPCALNEDLTFYSFVSKGPEALQVHHHPSVSLLSTGQLAGGGLREVEVAGKALLVRDEADRSKAQRLLEEQGAAVDDEAVEYVRIVTERIEIREKDEGGRLLSCRWLDFPENQRVISDGALLGRKAFAWLIGVRAPFLTASVVPVVLGGAIAWATRDALNWGLLFLALIAGALLHLSVNVFNDYFDNRSGNDPLNVAFIRPFSGGSRVIQMGLLSPLEVLFGAILLSAISAGIGGVLAWAAGPWVIAFGVAGLISGVFYVAGPFNWASRGVGEFVVGLNFGTLMTLGSYYVQTGRVDWAPAIASIPAAALIAAVLYVNEFPDFAADEAVGKRTLIVRLGRQRAVIGYAFLMTVPYVVVPVGVGFDVLPVQALIATLTLPLSLRAVQCAARYHSQPLELAPANALTIIIHLSTGLLLTLAFVWDGSGLAELGYLLGLSVLFAFAVLFVSRGIEQEKRAFLAAREPA
jgi:1,4-dihydroxy-2-naphthoate octaprenyltransferase